MDMTLKQVHDFLVSNEYVTVVGNKVLLSNKYARDLFNDNSSEVLTSITTLKPTDVLTQLIKYLKDNGCSSTATNQSSVYALFRRTKENIDRLEKILKTVTDLDGESIKLELFCKATWRYYKSTNFPVTLTNYLKDDVWLSFYEDEKKRVEEIKIDRRSIDL